MTGAARIEVGPLRAVAASAVVGTSASRTRETVTAGATTAGSPFRIASLSKPLTAVAVLLATQRAGIELDAPVLEVLPGLRTDWAADHHLTIAEVLSQTSGLAPTVTSDDIADLGDHDMVFSSPRGGKHHALS